MQLLTDAGSPHAWMGSHPVVAHPGVAPPYADFDSSAVVWNFHITHPGT